MSEEVAGKDNNIRDLIRGMAVYSSASVLGPLIIFGGIGYFLDQAYNGKHLILLGSILVAFVITNILIFRKAMAIMAELEKIKSAGHVKNGYDDDDLNDEW